MTAKSPPIDQLKSIMAKLRSPTGGCPWDIEQTFQTIAPHTIEEAYEVADAIEQGDMTHLKDELGDLLFQVIFHAQMADEAGHFNFDQVAQSISDKMIRRHPHVFGDEDIKTAEAQTKNWEEQKASERLAKAKDKGEDRVSVLADVSPGLPALTRALKLQKRAARVGFDWPDTVDVVAKIDEELAEVKAELPEANKDNLQEEIGDLLFVVVNLARKLDIDPETALRNANGKFVRRFQWIEDQLHQQGSSPQQSDLAEMDGLWDQAKLAEKKP